MKTNIMKFSVIIVVLSVIIVVLLVIIIPLHDDSFIYDESLIEKQIAADFDLSNVKIRNIKDLDSIRAIVFTDSDNNIGLGTLIKNAIGRYKIDTIGVGTSRLFRCIIFKINDKNYLFLVGKNEGNITNGVVHITGLDNQDKPIAFYKKLKIPDEEYFVVIEEVNSTYDIEGNFSDTTQFYDKNGKNVTSKLLKY